ncbi:MAG: hypothetical protein ABI411_00840 [Tahibacter sp.]
MSFQWYLQVFAHGMASGVSRDALRRSVAGVLVEIDEDYWQADFGTDGPTDLFLQSLTDEPSLIHCISFDHVNAIAPLARAVWELLGESGSVFHFPGCAAALARDAKIGLALPADLLGALGPPMIIQDDREIVRAFECGGA